MLLVAADAISVVALFIGLSAWRFGTDWFGVWQGELGDPVVFLGLYTGTWIVVLALNGLYRPRARWSTRAEAAGAFRATATMLVITLSVLFLVRLPDVSRLFLIVLFPSQALATIAVRAVLRIGFERLRERGYNVRYVLVVGAG